MCFMGVKKDDGNLRYFQIRISHKQGKHLPGYKLTNYFDRVEMVAATGKIDSVPSSIVKVEYNNINFSEIGDELKESLIIDKILQEHDNFAYLRVRTPGPIQMIIAEQEECWVTPPTYLSKENGFFMTIQGIPNGLKRVKDKLELLIPEKMEMRISKIIAGDWIAAPKLPEKRNLVIRIAVEKGYYETPRRCTQKDIADDLGIQQGTVAEHLQYAESMIINSWSEQISQS